MVTLPEADAPAVPVVADDVLVEPVVLELVLEPPDIPSASLTIRSIAAMCVSTSPDALADAEPVIVPVCDVPVWLPLCVPYCDGEPVVDPVADEPVVEDPVVEPLVVEPVIEPAVEEPVIEPLDIEPEAEADPPAALWKACRCVRNSSSLVRSAGSSDVEALPLVPTVPVVLPVVDELAASELLAESSAVSVWFTCV